jgi:hypothetical protein
MAKTREFLIRLKVVFSYLATIGHCKGNAKAIKMNSNPRTIYKTFAV